MLDPFKIVVEIENTKNAAPGIWDFLKDYIYPLLPTLLGSGIFGFFFWKRRKKQEEKIKAEVQKEVEAYKTELQTTANKLSLEISEKITRRSKAYDFITGIEYDYYSKLLVCLQTTSNSKIELFGNVKYYDSSNPSLLLKAQTEYRKSLNEIRELHLSVLHIIRQDLSDIVGEYIIALFEYGKKVSALPQIPSSKQVQILASEMENMDDEIAKKCVKVNAAVSIVIKAQSNGIEPDLSVFTKNK